MIRVRVSDLLKGRQLTIKGLALAAGLRYQTVFDFVKGKTRGVDWRTLDAICEALRVQPGDVLHRQEAGPKLKKDGR